MPEFIPVIKKHDIQRQILRIAETISTDYQGRELVLIGVLKGAFLFLADLARELKLETVKIDFLQASSYGADTVSSENVVLKKDIDVDIRGKDVLVVEDIVDTGLTLACIIRHLERFNPAVLAMKPFLTTPVFIESNRISTFKRRGVDVDVVLDLMIHDIDIILNIVKSPIKTIHTVGAPVATANTDIANARLIFENGATANVTVSRISRTNVRQMRIFQPGSYINVDFGNRKVMTI